MTVIALIGHSGAGKTACSSLINGNRDGDMDLGLGTIRSPSILLALDWLTDPVRPAVVVVSNHEKMLNSLHAAKLNNDHSTTLNRIWFVYLHKPKDRLRLHLTLLTSSGETRSQNAQRYTLESYERFHSLYSGITDQTVDCSKASVHEVTKKIRLLVAARSLKAP